MAKRVATAAAVCVIGLHGCALQLAQRNSDMDALIVSGDFAAAARLAEQRMGLLADEAGALPPVSFVEGKTLDHLDAAEAWRLAGDRARALSHFDAAETTLKQVELQLQVASLGKSAAAVLINDTLLDYMPSPAEATLINYYKALAFLANGDDENARVEFNRADDRTRRAVERYESEIAKAQEKANEQQRAQAASALPLIEQRFAEMQTWKPYDAFVNPAVVYAGALFFAHQGDPGDVSRAQNHLQRVVGLAPENPAVSNDYDSIKRGSICGKPPCTWVILEHGLGPEFVENRFEVPVPFNSGLINIALALPKLVSRADPMAPLVAVNVPSGVVQMHELATMDRVIQTEFSKRFPGIVTRAVLSATAKALAQNELNKQAGPWGGLAGMLLTSATTAADTRSWRSTPGSWLVAKLEQTPAATLSIATSTGQLLPVMGDATGNSLVYIKQSTSTAEPLVEVISL